MSNTLRDIPLRDYLDLQRRHVRMLKMSGGAFSLGVGIGFTLGFVAALAVML